MDPTPQALVVAEVNSEMHVCVSAFHGSSVLIPEHDPAQRWRAEEGVARRSPEEPADSESLGVPA